MMNRAQPQATLSCSALPQPAPRIEPLIQQPRSLGWLSRLVFSLAMLVVAAPLLSGMSVARAADAHLSLDRLPGTPQAPDFVLMGADGDTYRLADFKGQPLIVNFWATWCPPCRAEMPSMQRAWEQIEQEGIGLIAINVGEDLETVQAFLEQVPVNFPLPLDTDSRIAQRWPMRGLPTTFVVAPDGRLIYQAIGEREWDDPALLEKVRALKIAE
ncbi:MAG: TlpA disulfide reductase family protein [Lamprobacter sp.]|uniref:peroxiredoxin family protein n=1 Tax=Lamprobacter sp. TaxID=3100796 RepID=UPI002B25D22A|nr:TlpA disulfide reductase family protein [Lamprobacter sp.]MEA3639406.1 TlpA disulfide reductase family protein [Lamprobacter sp.]